METSDWIQLLAGLGTWAAVIVAMTLGYLSHRDRQDRDKAEGLLLAYQVTTDLERCNRGLQQAQNLRRLLHATENPAVYQNVEKLLSDLAMPIVRKNISKLHLLPAGSGLDVAKAIPQIDEITELVKKARALHAPQQKDNAAEEIANRSKIAAALIAAALDHAAAKKKQQ